MQSKVKFSSVRLMLTLFICSASMLMLYNIFGNERPEFLSQIISVPVGVAITLVYFVPSVIIKRRTGVDFISFVKQNTPSAIIFISAYYALYFAFLLTGFMLRYTDMFSSSLNPETSVYVLSFVLLLTGVYTAVKGINTISRISVFIFAFLLLAFLLIFGGNIANLDFNVNSTELKTDYNSLMSGIAFFSSVSFIAVIFAFTSQSIKKYRLRHTIITVFAIFIFAALIVFFICFSLGSYGCRQPYQFCLLSRTSDYGAMRGMESFYLAAASASIFVLISSLLTCVKHSVEAKSGKRVLLLFALSVYILFVCAGTFNSVKEILNSIYVLNILNFISAVLIPTIYIIIFRRRLNV